MVEIVAGQQVLKQILQRANIDVIYAVHIIFRNIVLVSSPLFLELSTV